MVLKTELFDLEEGNWKNSEVISIFAENIQSQESPEQTLEQVLTKEEPISLEASLDAATLEALAAELDISLVKEDLSVMASEAAKSGNIKAAHLIELTLSDL